MISPKKFVHYLRNSTLDIPTQESLIEILPNLEKKQIESLYIILKSDSGYLEKNFTKAESMYKLKAMKLLNKFESTFFPKEKKIKIETKVDSKMVEMLVEEEIAKETAKVVHKGKRPKKK